MLTIEEIDEIGFTLEDGGLSHSEIDEYFEHAGVKGMKWGVRREQAVSALRTAGRGTATAAKATGEFTWKHKKAIGAVVVGAAVTALILSNKSKVPKLNTKTITQSKFLLSQHQKTQMRDIMSAAKEVKGYKMETKELKKYVPNLYKKKFQDIGLIRDEDN